MLSDRLRPNIEAAPWVIDEVRKLEQELADTYLEMRKIRPAVRAIFDRDVWEIEMEREPWEPCVAVAVEMIRGVPYVEARYLQECVGEIARLKEALALPHDNSALSTRLAQERERCAALYAHEDVQAPVGQSAWGEVYQEGWIAGCQAFRDAIRNLGDEA